MKPVLALVTLAALAQNVAANWDIWFADIRDPCRHKLIKHTSYCAAMAGDRKGSKCHKGENECYSIAKHNAAFDLDTINFFYRTDKYTFFVYAQEDCSGPQILHGTPGTYKLKNNTLASSFIIKKTKDIKQFTSEDAEESWFVHKDLKDWKLGESEIPFNEKVKPDCSGDRNHWMAMAMVE